MTTVVLLKTQTHKSQFTPEIFYEIISNKFPTFALYLTEINTNPVNYF